MIAGTGVILEFLDISRCRDIKFNDIAEYIREMSAAQAIALRYLMIGGLKAYGRTTTDLFSLIASRLTSLEVLDCNGCVVKDRDLATWARAHRDLHTTSPVTHLVLSSCASLTSNTIGYLMGLTPNIEKLEMAGMPRLLSRGNASAEVPRLLRGMPHLRKIDMEKTAASGAVGDEVLEVLGGMGLEEVRMGDAEGITAEAWVRFVHRCKSLRVLEVDVSGSLHLDIIALDLSS
jgi:hypothetical protein